MQRAQLTSQVLLVTAILYACLAPAACVYESQILAFLNEFRMRMCHPIPNLGLPALDPLKLGPAETALNNKYLVDFAGSIDNFTLHGLSDFDVPVLTLNPVPALKSTINVTFPLTYFESLYTAKGSLAYIVNVAGDGNAETSITNFSILISFRLKSLSPLAIYSLQIELHLGDLKINFENLLEEERINEFIHALVNEMGVELLGDVWDYGQGTVVSKVQTAVNNFLGEFSLQDILQIITGGGGGEESAPIFDGVEPDCKLEASSSN
ncbi:uncharacterized protein LOC128266530 [Drosophila gunungcola]|uniref:Uncharacterized protein n=1 Tax=Drosophila gunungcola TaxID=103775 RepID=A0A9Q0BW91_9MUSC|nr:uncharacterized protein LOC128266530 [Drosophila gunungcola]KAI8046129.1 hypothetical protein M5D96_002329 [Drosophila gunungcola]